ncbi:MAG: S1 RNA-binding domain-containing protein [Candidatus Mycalebacterium zealandia]|nr:MAG: S1 RNA-binding domain-containing protein [Candidatus Mycalebacterium zealandia]
MTDFAKKTAAPDNSQSFSQLLDESGFAEENTAGKIVNGTIVRVEEENVFINIGMRSEGIVPLKEFVDENGNCEVAEGTCVDVLIKGVGRGLPKISKADADSMKHFEDLKQTFSNEQPVKVKAAKRIKGGVECVIEGTGAKAFLPSSQVLIGKNRQGADKVMNQSFDALIIEMEGRRIVLSRKKLLERERAEKMAEFVKQIDVGMLVKGVVSNIIPPGVFVDLTDGSGTIEGFIPVSEVAWKRIKTPGDVLKPGEEITVKIIDIRQDSGRIALSYKQTQSTPWEDFAEKTPQNSRIKGKIANVNEAGVFVEVAEGVVGLVHPDNISWKEKVDPVDEYGENKGKEIEVMMMWCDPVRKKMSLGVKQLQKDPWKTAVRKLKKGENVLTGKVKKEVRGGLVLELDDDIEGFIRFSDLADSDGGRDGEHYKTGMEITGVVKNIDNKSRTVTLSAEMLVRKNEREILKEFTNKQGEGSGAKLGDFISDKIGAVKNEEED